jgi:hypothetical protein
VKNVVAALQIPPFFIPGGLGHCLAPSEERFFTVPRNIRPENCGVVIGLIAPGMRINSYGPKFANNFLGHKIHTVMEIPLSFADAAVRLSIIAGNHDCFFLSNSMFERLVPSYSGGWSKQDSTMEP